MGAPAEDAKAAYREVFAQHGERVAVRRYFGTSASGSWVDAAVLAMVTGYQPNEMVGGVMQGDRKVIVLAEDLVTARFPLPIRRGDKVTIRGNEMNVENADDSSRRVAGALVAIELRVRGRQ